MNIHLQSLRGYNFSFSLGKKKNKPKSENASGIWWAYVELYENLPNSSM